MNTIHSHTYYSHTNNHYECPIEIGDMIHRLEADGSVGQFLRPVGMMYIVRAHTHTHKSNSATTAF